MLEKFLPQMEFLAKILDYRTPLSRKKYCQFCLIWAFLAISLSILNPLLWILFFWASFPVFFIFSMQRLNDMGIKRRWIAIGIIPIIGLAFFFYTLIAPRKV